MVDVGDEETILYESTPQENAQRTLCATRMVAPLSFCPGLIWGFSPFFIEDLHLLHGVSFTQDVPRVFRIEASSLPTNGPADRAVR